ncbi:hypothetical protein L1987_72489 [Smallanthus sonchifolius]|uniref:Uncharacterized protein n=1 Tax=Smallanthus sonchifolius TaxID=185202 RepID=A0ACB9AUI8_9ASTR|nr:hypothetical protein L1987_72489 [Smallanthus sonchifolius]
MDNILSVEKGRLGFCWVLFQKELTASDVGKSNRLVIPKKHALRYFKSESEVLAQGLTNDEVFLSLYDSQRKVRKFRYCYWKSSQTFVFTKGWKKFVKDNELMPKDKIIFYFQEDLQMQNKGILVIDTCKSSSHIGLSLKLSVKQEEEGLKDDKKDVEMIQTSIVKKSHGFKLFGVQIIE